jgi:hypothetical protein
MFSPISGDGDLMSDAVTKAVKAIEKEKDEMVRAAIISDVDGIDFVEEYHTFDSDEPYKIDIGGHSNCWMDEPPEYGPEVMSIERYDFRNIDRKELRRLAINNE